MKSVLMIADSRWSTGTIAKDIAALSKEWKVDLLDWSKCPDDFDEMLSKYDSVVVFVLTSPHYWPSLLKCGVVCCGPVDFELMAKQGLSILNSCVGAVSRETYDILNANKSYNLFYTPATARFGRFERRPIRQELKMLGWCGVPSCQDKFSGYDAKNYALFSDIAARERIQQKVSYTNYTYETMQTFYDSIDMLICTSHSEGGPLPIFEAIACGVPVISTDVGMTQGISNIWKFATAEEAGKIIEMLKDPGFRMDYANAQYRFLYERVSMEHFVPLWERFFEGVRQCRLATRG